MDSTTPCGSYRSRLDQIRIRVLRGLAGAILFPLALNASGNKQTLRGENESRPVTDTAGFPASFHLICRNTPRPFRHTQSHCSIDLPAACSFATANDGVAPENCTGPDGGSRSRKRIRIRAAFVILDGISGGHDGQHRQTLARLFCLSKAENQGEHTKDFLEVLVNTGFASGACRCQPDPSQHLRRKSLAWESGTDNASLVRHDKAGM